MAASSRRTLSVDMTDDENVPLWQLPTAQSTRCRRTTCLAAAALALVSLATAALLFHERLGAWVGQSDVTQSIVSEANARGCTSPCARHGGHTLDCRGVVLWAAEHKFKGRDSCIESYTYAMAVCPACWACSLLATGCQAEAAEPKRGGAASVDLRGAGAGDAARGAPVPTGDTAQDGEWACHHYDLARNEDNAWCRAAGTVAGTEFRFVGEAGSNLCQGCWCCRRPARASSRASSPARPNRPPPPPPSGPPRSKVHTYGYNAENPLRIQTHAERTKNFFLVVGDWGKAGGPGPCQVAVAEKMKAYVRTQREAGNNLLFVASVGDNFYWTGVTPDAWERQWASTYGTWDATSPLYQVPWLSVLGNHDLGNDDTYALCPEKQPLATLEGKHYGSKQFNADRNPLRPDAGCDDAGTVAAEPARCAKNTSFYWLPDYNYHYELPAAGLEVIALDTNDQAIDAIGGDASGHSAAFAACGGRGAVAAHLATVARAARKLLRQRARRSVASTVVIIQHYPGQCMREVFEQALPAARRGRVRVLCAYGHVHDQRCDRRDPESGACDTVLTGGGGGCCAPEVNMGGFTAVHLSSDGGFVADVESPFVRLPRGQCAWAGPRRPGALIVRQK